MYVVNWYGLQLICFSCLLLKTLFLVMLSALIIFSCNLLHVFQKVQNQFSDLLCLLLLIFKENKISMYTETVDYRVYLTELIIILIFLI